MKTMVPMEKVNKRNRRGMTLGLVAALGLVLALIGVGLFAVSLLLGGTRETRNAVESGALNVGKQALEITVPATTYDQQQFNDVADSKGQFGLKNIDRVWGKAILAAINETAMENEGSNSSNSSSDNTKLQNAAQELSSQLSQQLNQPANLYDAFRTFAGSGSVRMLGSNAHVDVMSGNNWQTALMDRGAESNISVDTSQLPSSFSSGDVSNLQLVKAKDGNSYLPGYTGVQLVGQSYWCVPFKVSEKPHLVAGDHFEENTLTANALPWTDAIPNAFCVHGGAVSAQKSQESIASVITNPQLEFKLQIPQAFVRVKLLANTLQWNLNGIDMETDNYQFAPGDTKTSITYPLPCGTIYGTEYCGFEYTTGPTLLTGMLGLRALSATSTKTFQYLLQRCQEIHPGLQANDLITMLTATPISTDGDQEFIIWPTSNDSNAKLMVTPASGAPSWANTQPDGSDGVLETEGPLGPNWGLTDLVCYGDYEYPSYSSFYGELRWQPGTGYDGCLGTVTVHRTTTAYLFGFCSCP